MSKAARGGLMPLLVAPGETGLTLRAQIYKACVDAIVKGRLPVGSRLPSARQLAGDWNVARNTVDDALAQLQAEGFVARRVGDGTFVAASIPGRPAPVLPSQRPPAAPGLKVSQTISARGRDAVSQYQPGGMPRPVPFFAGLPDLDQFPLELWRRLVARRLRNSGRELLGYFSSMGHPPLREATARYLAASRGIDCSAEQIMILNGTMQGADLIARILPEARAEAWVENPGFADLSACLAMSGVTAIPVPVDAHGIDVLHGRALSPGAAFAYVTPSCQYPTGAVLSLERRIELLRWAEESGSWIVEDDYQSEFTYEGHPLTALHTLDGGQRVLYLGTYSNAVFPSLRLAYLVLPETLVGIFKAVRGQIDDHTHGLDQAVMADFADGGHFAAHLRRMRAMYQSRRDALVGACRKELAGVARLGPTSSGMNAALYLERRSIERALLARAQAAGLKLRPLVRDKGSSSQNYGLLLGYAALPERKIAAGIATLARVIAS